MLWTLLLASLCASVTALTSPLTYPNQPYMYEPGQCLCVIADNTQVHGNIRESGPPYPTQHPSNKVIATAYHGQCFMYTGFSRLWRNPQVVFDQVSFDDDGLLGWIDSSKLEIPTDGHKCPMGPKFVHRDGPFGWGARKPRREIPKRTGPWTCVVLHRTATRHCKNKQDCLQVVKEIQRYHMKEQGLADIKNNFIVGEDGRVYVGRGYNRTGAHTDGYNKCCLGITVVDSFMDRLPLPPALDAVAQVIAYGVAKNFIDPGYTLCLHNSVNPLVPCPGIAYSALVKGDSPIMLPPNPAKPYPNPYGTMAWPHFAPKCPFCPK